MVLWRYGTGTVSTDDPNTPENESGRWEVNAQFDGNTLVADTCHPGTSIWPNPCHTGAPSFSGASRVVHAGRGKNFTVGIFCGGDAGRRTCSATRATEPPRSARSISRARW